ncbi:MAG TPA: lipid-A-disaccharide synthase [Holosporales bacterium]|nr:lipid-A-disaccharide synthase [Holosporales bacterium]
MSSKPLVFLIVGEASGDKLGADLMASIKKQQDIRFMGIGGEGMKTQGLKSLFPMEELSHMGLWGILRDLPNLYQRLRLTVKTIQEIKPSVVVSIDSPEFSFRVMKRLHRLSPRPHLVHYVAPTVWAWRPGRARKIARFLDQLFCLYPFEPQLFEKHGLKATFIGHPIAKTIYKKRKRDPNLLCVLPGSRRSEIQMLLPIFRETVALLKKEIPELKVVLPTLPAFQESIQNEVKSWPLEVKVVVGEKKRDEAFEQAYVALAASGTVALQLAAARLPFVIAYKIGVFSGKIARLLIRTPWVCMVNILLAYEKGSPLSNLLTPRGLTAGSIALRMDPAIKSRDVNFFKFPKIFRKFNLFLTEN